MEEKAQEISERLLDYGVEIVKLTMKYYTFAFFTEFLDFTGKMPVPPDW